MGTFFPEQLRDAVHAAVAKTKWPATANSIIPYTADPNDDPTFLHGAKGPFTGAAAASSVKGYDTYGFNDAMNGSVYNSGEFRWLSSAAQTITHYIIDFSAGLNYWVVVELANPVTVANGETWRVYPNEMNISIGNA